MPRNSGVLAVKANTMNIGQIKEKIAFYEANPTKQPYSGFAAYLRYELASKEREAEAAYWNDPANHEVYSDFPPDGVCTNHEAHIETFGQ